MISGDSIRRAVASLVPTEALLSPDGLGPWSDDLPSPAVVLAPEQEEEVAAVLSLASEEGWRVLPLGMGGWYQGGGLREVEILLSTRRLGGMAEYEPADLTFSAGAGLPMEELRRRTGGEGQWLPLDPPGSEDGSLGGLAALGVSGPLRHAFGAPRDHILGLTLISGDGRILRWGGRVVKNVAGFDVTRLAIGSWGTLGIITSVSARLFPLPEVDRTLILTGPSPLALLSPARAMALSPLPLSAVELVSSCMGFAPGGVGPAGLVLRLLGSEAQVEEMTGTVQKEVGALGHGEGILVLDGPEAEAFQRALNRYEDGGELVLRLSLLPHRMGDLLNRVDDLRDLLEGKASTSVALAAHVGWGVVRVVARSGVQGGLGAPGVAQALVALRRDLEEEGGSLRISRGPAPLLEEVGAWGKPSGEEGLLTGLKAQFDPSGIMAPGRLGIRTE